MIRLQKVFAVQDEIRDQLVPRFRPRRANRMALEWDKRFRAFVDRQFQVRVRTIRLVSQNARDVELLVVFVMSGAKNGASWVFRSVTSIALMTLVFTPQTA